jgi:hemerythrin superfamily protein
MTIFEVLKNDHSKIKELLTKLEKDPINKELFTQLVQILMMHNHVEERTFYVLLKKKTGDYRIIADSSEKEHNLVKDIINYIKIADFDQNECKVLVPILKRMVEAHIIKEEKNIFPLAKDIFSEDELEDIKTSYEKEKGVFDMSIIKPHIKVNAITNQPAEEVNKQATQTVVISQEDA